MKSDEAPIIVEQTYQASAKAVWEAITQVDQMRHWYFQDIPEFEARVGFETGFDVHTEERCFPHRWRVTSVIPDKQIQYDWHYEGFPGACTVRFELDEENDSTTLKVTCKAQEDFPDDIPEFKRESGEAGWQFLLQESLKEYLEDPSAYG